MKVNDNTEYILVLSHGFNFANDKTINNRIINQYNQNSYLFSESGYQAVVFRNIISKWHDYVEKLYATTLFEYNPINNYEMTETENIADEKTGINNGTISEKNNAKNSNVNQLNLSQNQNGGQSENKNNPNYVVPFNSGGEKEFSKTMEQNNTTTKNNTDTDSVEKNEQNTTGETDTKTFNSNTDNGKTDRTLKRSGNIGVTTSQQMIESERKIILDCIQFYVDKFSECFKWELGDI